MPPPCPQAHLFQPFQMAQHHKDGLARLVRPDVGALLQVVVDEPEPALDALFALQQRPKKPKRLIVKKKKSLTRQVKGGKGGITETTPQACKKRAGLKEGRVLLLKIDLDASSLFMTCCQQAAPS